MFLSLQSRTHHSMLASSRQVLPFASKFVESSRIVGYAAVSLDGDKLGRGVDIAQGFQVLAHQSGLGDPDGQHTRFRDVSEAR